MGPRLVSRGKTQPTLTTSETTGLQWGRDLLVAESLRFLSWFFRKY